MPRNLVICLDGTAGQARGPGDSNSVRIWDLLDHSDETQQIAYYDPGVGTFASAGAWTAFARWFSRLGGLIWGGGLRQNLGEVYLWLVEHWQPGDKVFVFGFSRGAFTARALVGMLRAIGAMRPGSENQLQYAVAAYARRAGEEDEPWPEVQHFAKLFARKVRLGDQTSDGTTIPVDYVGLWDTVKAMGTARRAPKWPFTRSLPNARRVRHAIAIDERRRPFSEYVVELGDPDKRLKVLGAPQRLEEVWFAGIHTDVGGTHVDEDELSTITLKWILEGAIEEGMRVREQAVRNLFATVVPTSASGIAHRNHWIWALLIPRRRPIPEGAVLHASVRERMAALPGYRPQLPVDRTWADETWAGTGAP